MKQDLLSLLTSDSRFIKSGTKFQKVSSQLAEVFADPEVSSIISADFKVLKNAIRFLNILLFANRMGDSEVLISYDKSKVLEILKTGEVASYSDDLLDVDLKEKLQSDFLEYSSIEFNQVEHFEEFQGVCTKDLFKLSSSCTASDSANKIETAQSVSSSHQTSNLDTEFWVRSVQLDFPFPAQPNGNLTSVDFIKNNTEYCVYAEGTLPWNQSQISAVSDVNKFSDKDILNLFPPIRLYTRSPFMYKQYEGLEYDEDLGVIFKIKGVTKKQFIKNLIEYPHLEHLDRAVKRSGEETTIEFWKHIEIDGEIYPTASVWDKLPDTKKLPKTESFMNEYVARKYILECEKGIEHKYPMRGTLESFLTLYAPPSYYENYKYDPITIGKSCIAARISFKRSRNPVLKMIDNEELSL
jgi:hypothetical protein